jgi:prepilin peptidase CpaA
MFYELSVLLIFPFALIFAGISDAMSYTIPNKVSLILFVSFVLLVPFSGLSLAEIGSHVVVGFLMLVVGFLLFARGYFGGGDAKIIAAASLWLGPDYTGMFILFAAFYGGILSLFIMKIYNTPLPPFLAGQKWLVNYQTGKAAVPYGIAIGVAGLSIFPQTHWMGLV